ncbi:MAG: Crp/Fnr family transcriptional regulator [Cyanobacteria bacterium P01_D01_bin.105]
MCPFPTTTFSERDARIGHSDHDRLENGGSNRMADYYQPQLFHFKRHDLLHFRDSGLWRIQSGYVRTLTWNTDGEFVPLGFWQRGDVIGCAIAQASPYKAQCLTPVTAEYLGSRYCFSKCDVLAQVRQSNELLQISHCRSADMRLLNFLCWAAKRFGTLCTLSNQAKGYRHLLKLTHQELGESIGITRVTVTRLLKGLEQDGFIQWNSQDKVIFPEAFQQCGDHMAALKRSSSNKAASNRKYSRSP